MQSFPWNSIATELGEDGLPVYDRAYSADDLREVYETFFSDGVFLTQDGGAFKVSPDTGMTVVVAPGKCCIKGTVGWEDEERKLILQASASDLDRIDTVVLRWNTNTEARSIDLYVKTGVAAEAPKRPELTRNDSVYELGLADIFVAKETASIVRQRVTDTRMESLRCGAVTPLLFIDTTSFYDQLQAQTDVAVELANAALHDSMLGYFIDTVYPVGSFYMSMNPTNPHDLFGGTWTKLEDYYLRAGSDTNTGGSNAKTLTVENIPEHNHSMIHTHTTAAHSHGTGDTYNTKFAAYSPEVTLTTTYFTPDNSINGSKVPKVLDFFDGTMALRTPTGTAAPSTNSQSTNTTGTAGAGTPFDIMPKYQNIHVWYRVA